MDIEDIDAQIAALKEKRKKIIQEQLEAEKKETEQRRIKIGEIVENCLGSIKDLDEFRRFIVENADKFAPSNDSLEDSDKTPIAFA